MSNVLARLNVLVGADASGLESALEGAAQKMQRVGRKLQATGRRLSTRVTLPLAAIGAASVKMASDAEEAANKFDVVMGPSADRVRSRLRELSETIPLTTAEMEGMAAGIQDLLVPMGLARSDAADMSSGMVELAGDLASFNNVLPTEALMAMRSALAGESEPMRRFGVDTRVARLEALALREGLIEVGEELNETARAQAVMLAIQEDSKDAMGDAARTADSTANTMKFLARDVKQLGIDIGQVLIPAVRPLLMWLREKLELLKNLDAETLTWGVAIAGLVATIGPLVVAIGAMVSALGTLATAFVALNAAIGPAGWVILGLSAAAAGFALWKSRTDDQAVAMDELNNSLRHFRANMDMDFSLYRHGGGEDDPAEQAGAVSEALNTLNSRLRQVNRLQAALGDHFDASKERANAFREAIETLVEEGVDPASDAIQRLRDMLDLMHMDAAGVVGESGPAQGITALNEKITSNIDLLQQSREVYESVSNRIGERAASVASTIGDNFTSAFTSLVTGAKKFGQAFADMAKGILRDIAQMIARMLVMRAIMAIFSGGTALPGMAFAGIPGRAHGGPVQRNRPFIVGERGPELFVPSSAGNIVSNDQMGGANVSSVADEILSRIGSEPQMVTPDALATSRFWRSAFAELVEVGKRDGVRFDK